MTTSDILSALCSGPSVWMPASRPKQEILVFIRAKNDEKSTHLDNTSHLINKIVLGNDYEWAEVKKL